MKRPAPKVSAHQKRNWALQQRVHASLQYTEAKEASEKAMDERRAERARYEVILREELGSHYQRLEHGFRYNLKGALTETRRLLGLETDPAEPGFADSSGLRKWLLSLCPPSDKDCDLNVQIAASLDAIKAARNRVIDAMDAQEAAGEHQETVRRYLHKNPDEIIDPPPQEDLDDLRDLEFDLPEGLGDPEKKEGSRWSTSVTRCDAGLLGSGKGCATPHL